MDGSFFRSDQGLQTRLSDLETMNRVPIGITMMLATDKS